MTCSRDYDKESQPWYFIFSTIGDIFINIFIENGVIFTITTNKLISSYKLNCTVM